MSKHSKDSKPSKDYTKMMKNNRKKLITLSKEVVPWEGYDGITLLITHLEWVKEYYSNNENVVAKEDYEWDPEAIKKSRLQMVTEILNEYYDWQNCEEKYYKLIRHPETYKTHKNKDGTVTIDDLGCHIEFALGDRETTRKAFNDEYNFHKHKFFELLEKYIGELWD